MEKESRRFSDSEFLVEFNKINTSNIGDNVLRIFRIEMRKKGLLKDRERLEMVHLQFFKEMVSLRTSQNLRWQEAAEKTVFMINKKTLEDQAKIESLILKVNGNGDFDSKIFDEFCEIAKKYDFSVTKFFHLQTEITDELSKLPLCGNTKSRIHGVYEDIMNLIISYFYVSKNKS